jgi:hypothetical protein
MESQNIIVYIMIVILRYHIMFLIAHNSFKAVHHELCNHRQSANHLSLRPLPVLLFTNVPGAFVFSCTEYMKLFFQDYHYFMFSEYMQN